MISEKEIEKVQYSNSFQGAVEALCTLLHAFQVALVLDSTRPQKKRFFCVNEILSNISDPKS